MGAVRTRYLAPTIPICTLHWTLTYLGTSMYIGPHTCMSGYVSAYHGVGKLCILLHTILCHAVTLGWKCIPLAVESYGNWGFEARQAFSHLASRLSFGIGHLKSKLLVDIYGRLNVTLVRCNARALLSRACNLF